MEHLDSELGKVVQFFKTELSHLQIGRANASLVEHLEVEVYGSKQPLKNVATISIPEAKQIAIQPWDKTMLSAIEKAIFEAKIGFTPVNDGTMIRLNIPQLTEERRKELVKLLWKMAEEAKISIRNVRQEHMKQIKQREKELGEDGVKHQEKQIQDKVDQANKDIEEAAKKKEQEIMTV